MDFTKIAIKNTQSCLFNVKYMSISICLPKLGWQDDKCFWHLGSIKPDETVSIRSPSSRNYMSQYNFLKLSTFITNLLLKCQLLSQKRTLWWHFFNKVFKEVSNYWKVLKICNHEILFVNTAYNNACKCSYYINYFLRSALSNAMIFLIGNNK